MSDQDDDRLQMCPIYIANNESQALPFIVSPIFRPSCMTRIVALRNISWRLHFDLCVCVVPYTIL